jgi:hypothetical protein
VGCKAQRNKAHIIKDNAVHGEVLKVWRIKKIKKYGVCHKYIMCTRGGFTTYFGAKDRLKVIRKSKLIRSVTGL